MRKGSINHQNLPSQGPTHCNSPLQPFKETKRALQKQFAHWSNRSEPLNLSQPSDSQKLRSFYNNQPTDLSARAENTLQHYANLSSPLTGETFYCTVNTVQLLVLQALIGNERTKQNWGSMSAGEQRDRMSCGMWCFWLVGQSEVMVCSHLPGFSGASVTFSWTSLGITKIKPNRPVNARLLSAQL